MFEEFLLEIQTFCLHQMGDQRAALSRLEEKRNQQRTCFPIDFAFHRGSSLHSKIENENANCLGIPQAAGMSVGGGCEGFGDIFRLQIIFLREISEMTYGCYHVNEEAKRVEVASR